ncbi:putative general secretion pathway protein GspM [Pseudomonas sp. CFII64]|uniref:type II secretion system protein GspM n=1 Tax=Pseudomonas sp. CFII64 TaxID=911242 RepID=UPI000356F682|nr:type II secretion system protein GspM [Pseudomonas sp. CFII64]EPJ79887.1 putative general secretion pathway protein GspM [Pseudomonas sp. CFII64]
MGRPLTPRERRVGAWLLVVVMLAGFHFLVIQPFLIAPLQEVDAQMDTLRKQRQHYQRLLALGQRLQQAMEKSPGEDSLHNALLKGDDPSVVAAELMQKVAQMVKDNEARGAGCQVTQRMPILPQGQSQEPFRQIRLSLDLECATEPLETLLHQLESSQPLLFVDELRIRRANNAPANGGPGRLSVHLLVTGFLASGASTPAEEGSAVGQSALQEPSR